MFWDSKTLKNRAKDVLSGHYWEYFIAVVLAGILCGSVTHFTIRININDLHFRNLGEMFRYMLRWISTHYPSLVSSFALSGVGKTVWKIFIGNPFEVGREYKRIYGYPLGPDSNGAPVVYVWFVNDK